jgi:hypothetical protein
VAVRLSARGAEWFGGLSCDGHYDRLIEWARACDEAGAVLPTPPELSAFRFERFTGHAIAWRAGHRRV